MSEIKKRNKNTLSTKGKNLNNSKPSLSVENINQDDHVLTTHKTPLTVGEMSLSKTTIEMVGNVSEVNDAVSCKSGNNLLALNNGSGDLAPLSTNGLVTQLPTGALIGRSITVSSNLAVTNGDGILGNPSLDLSKTPKVDKITINNPPTSNTDGVNKQYVDALVAGIDFKNPCKSASTAALNAIYDNGTNGVNATLTNEGFTASFVLDGINCMPGDRVLIKDQSSQSENGIYVVTNVGDNFTNWVLTRASDYDNQTEITPGNLISIQKGTVNSNTAWLQTSYVYTIGNDNISYMQFAYGPSTFLQRSNNLSDLVNLPAAIVNLGLQRAVLSDKKKPATTGYIPFSNSAEGINLVQSYGGASIYSDINTNTLNITGGSSGIALHGAVSFDGGIELSGNMNSTTIYPSDKLEVSYNVTLPAQSPMNSQILLSDEVGSLNWVDYVPGTVTHVYSGASGTIEVGGPSVTPTLDLAEINPASSSYTYASLTVDKYGRVSSASSGTPPVTSITGAPGEITVTGTTTPTLGLATTGIVNDTYYNPSITVDTKGRVTKIQNNPGFNTAIFTASGTWMVPVGVSAAKITLIGGGGSGGSSTNVGGIGSGGGSGATTIVYLQNMNQITGSSINITIGNGGTANAAGTATTVAYTTSTQNYSFAANGGNPGLFGPIKQGGEGGASSTITGAVSGVSIAGANGSPSFLIPNIGLWTGIYISGAGGSSSFGGAGASVAAQTNTNGLVGRPNSGSGGSGAINVSSASIGGSGGSGICIIEY